MKRKQVAMLIAGAGIVVGATAVGIYIKDNQVSIAQLEDRIEITEGEQLDFKIEDCFYVTPAKAIDKIEVDTSEVDTSEAGTYDINLKYKDQNFKVTVYVEEAPVVAEENVNDEDYLVLMRTHLVGDKGSYSMDEESSEIIMDLLVAKGATESEVNWWLNQEGDYGLWADAVYGTADEQTESLAQQRMWLLEDLGDVNYIIHDEYVKAHQSNGSSSSSTQKPSNGSNNSSNNSSNGNGGSSSSNGGNSSSTPTPAPTPAPSGNSSSDSDYNPEFDEEGPGGTNDSGTATGGSSGNDFGGCITWR